MELVAIVVSLSLIEYFIFAAQAGAARGKYNVEAPATTGHPIFERKLRVQQNTLEQLVIFLPAIWLFALYVNAGIAAIFGLVFIVGRAIYAQSYVADPSKRTVGFMITFAAQIVLTIGALVGAAVTWIG
jgi:glutathione S-transferase